MSPLPRRTVFAAVALVCTLVVPASAQQPAPSGTWRFLERLGGRPA